MTEKNKDHPLVTVVIPCYNHEQFVHEAIQSIIDQDYKNIELIIIDDGSGDKSVHKIKEKIDICSKRFSRFEFRSRSNKGVSATINEGIAWAAGEFLTICASDDSFHRGKVRVQVDYFLANEKCGFCYTGFLVCDDNSSVIDGVTKSGNAALHSDISFDDIFTFKKHFPVSGMYRIELIRDKLGGFDEAQPAEDFDIYLRLFVHTRPGYIEEKLFNYRYPGAVGGKRKRYAMRIDVSESHFKIINKYKKHPCYEDALTEWNFRRFIFFASHTKTKIYALKGMFKSLSKISHKSFIGALLRFLFVWR